MNPPLIPLGWFEVALLMGLMALAIAWSAVLRLGLTRDFLLGLSRSTLQLGAVGLVIAWVFRQTTWYAVIALLGVMAVIAGITAARQSGLRLPGVAAPLTGVLTGMTALVMAYLALVVLGVDEWNGRYLIPLWGMLLGNAMTAVTLVAERLTSGLRQGAREVETLLALGATPGQALGRLRREAIRAALTPTLNAMMVVGVVKLPGMMTGQILGGSPPFQAAMYQLMILFGIALCDLLSASATVWVLSRRFMTRQAQVDWGVLEEGG